MAAKKRNTQRKHIRSEGVYSSEELKCLTLDDGTRVVTSAEGDIKRPVCAGIDIHKEILMDAVCRTDSETLKAFLLRQTVTVDKQRYPPYGAMVQRPVSTGCLHGIYRQILDTCL